MTNETQEIAFVKTPTGFDVIGGKGCVISRQKRGQFNIWRNGKCYTASSEQSAKQMATNLALGLV